jgi:SIR2-like domain
MPPPGAPGRVRDSRDRLIFLEQEYLRTASTSASWPETLFLFHAQTTRMIFAGLSMSDANIRRWMSASEAELALDHGHVFSGKRVNPEHLWITRKPTDAILARIELVSMLHLGIRPAWITSWAEVEVALSNLLALWF